MLARATTRAARRALATSEASGKHVPWGASGSGTYTKSTKGCFDVIARAAPLVRAATERALAARAAAGTAHCTPFGIGDFGAADGGTSLPLLADVVAAVRAAEPTAPIVVGYEDQAQNDWQSLFALVGGTLEGGPPTYARAGNVFVSAVGTSFYESCFAPASLDLAVSFTAFHWLRDVPGPIPDALHSACSGDAATVAAYEAAAAEDWDAIVARRAAELKVGGGLVVANFAKDVDGNFLGTTPRRVRASMHDAFSELWREIAGDSAWRATNFPNQYRSLDACEAPFRDGKAGGLVLASAETDVVACPYHAEWVAAPSDDAAARRAAAETFVPTTRTWSNSTFVAGATAAGASDAEARALVDALFDRYVDRVAENPADHAMDYVHSYLRAEKH